MVGKVFSIRVFFCREEEFDFFNERTNIIKNIYFAHEKKKQKVEYIKKEPKKQKHILNIF
jgi:hypothetical protein